MRHKGKGDGKLLLISEAELMKRLARPPWWRGPVFFFAGVGVSQCFVWLLRQL